MILFGFRNKIQRNWLPKLKLLEVDLTVSSEVKIILKGGFNFQLSALKYRLESAFS